MADPHEPPPLPDTTALAGPLFDLPVLVKGRPFPGTEGMTLGDIELDVLKGGRFVTFRWNVSIIVLSFRNSTALRYVRADRLSGHHALGWGLFSLLFGWWGFPWGLIHTPVSLWKNASGGDDHTREALGLLLGEQHAAEIMLQAAPRKADPLLWTLRVLLVGLIGCGAYLLATVA